MQEATLISTDDKPVLRFEHFLPRPVQEVWRAVTDPVELRAWFPTRIEIDRWETGATLTHHFDEQPFGPLPGRVIECTPPHRLVFTWGDDTIGFELSATEGCTNFVLNEERAATTRLELSAREGGTTCARPEDPPAPAAAPTAAGWEVCLKLLVEGVVG